MKRLLAALAVALAACAPAAEQAAAPAASEQGTGVPQALAWDAELVGGGQLSGGDLAGRDVVLWFWAPW